MNVIKSIPKEIKIAAFAIVVIILAVWGYKFLLGKNLLNPSNIYYVKYSGVDGLRPSNPINFNGVQIGLVQKVEIDPTSFDSVLVTLDIPSSVKIPKKSTATVVSPSPLGGKAIIMDLEGECCAKSGSFLKGESFGLLKSAVTPDELRAYMSVLKDGAGSIMDTITTGDASGEMMSNLQATINNLASVTQKLDYVLTRSSADLTKTFDNLASISENLNSNNEKINAIINNADQLIAELQSGGLTKSLADAGVKANQTLDGLGTTISKAEATFDNLNTLLKEINEGDGLITKLTKDRELYDRITRTTTNLDLLLQDFRLNPKRYVNVSVFGKKQKVYAVPEQDPAFQAAPENDPDN